jgi:hypothetical protein
LAEVILLYEVSVDQMEEIARHRSVLARAWNVSCLTLFLPSTDMDPEQRAEARAFWLRGCWKGIQRGQLVTKLWWA